jgi:hypothetical protein
MCCVSSLADLAEQKGCDARDIARSSACLAFIHFAILRAVHHRDDGLKQESPTMRWSERAQARVAQLSR